MQHSSFASPHLPTCESPQPITSASSSPSLDRRIFSLSIPWPARRVNRPTPPRARRWHSLSNSSSVHGCRRVRDVPQDDRAHTPFERRPRRARVTTRVATECAQITASSSPDSRRRDVLRCWRHWSPASAESGMAAESAACRRSEAQRDQARGSRGQLRDLLLHARAGVGAVATRLMSVRVLAALDFAVLTDLRARTRDERRVFRTRAREREQAPR